MRRMRMIITMICLFELFSMGCWLPLFLTLLTHSLLKIFLSLSYSLTLLVKPFAHLTYSLSLFSLSLAQKLTLTKHLKHRLNMFNCINQKWWDVDCNNKLHPLSWFSLDNEKCWRMFSKGWWCLNEPMR